jgi:glycosyltransferase involved in cell wall biosynthesis
MMGSPLLPRRILMTADAVGGVWDYALELCRGLAESGIEVLLAVMGPAPAGRQAAAAAGLWGVELMAAPFRLEWMQEPWNDVAAAGEWLVDMALRRGCELAHLNGYAHGALPLPIPRVVVGHSCVLSWWRAVKGEPAPGEWARYRHEVASGLRRADRIVAPTCWMLNALEEHYGPLPPGEVIYNGRSAESYGPAPEKETFVLCAGRLWDEAKNAAAVARVAGRLPWPVKIAGATEPLDGEGASWPAGAATLLGKLSHERLQRLFARAAIYALPARYEPFGLTVLEAALSECALVLGDIPTLRELWDGAALFVPPDDDDALETALLTLMNQPELAAFLAARARRRAIRFSATSMVKRYLALYRGLMAAAGTREALTSCVS